MGTFKPPRLPRDQAAIQDAFQSIYSDLKALFRNEGTVAVHTRTYRAKAGETVRVSPPAAGMGLLLPPPDASNRGPVGAVTVLIESPEGALRVFSARGEPGPAPTVDGEETRAFTTAGTVVFTSNGRDGWLSLRGAGESSEAEFVVGAASADLPNARVATDSTEIDAVLTTPNVITWALNVASVAFSKLADLAGLSVLGRSTSSAGVMAAITATGGSQRLASNTAGTSIGFESYLSTQHDDTVTGTLDPYLLPASFKHDDSLVWVITGDVTLRRIRMSDDSVPPDGFRINLSLRDQSGGVTPGWAITIEDTGAVTTNGSFRTPGQVQGTSPGPSYVMRSEEEGGIWVIRQGNWRLLGGTAAQAITGPITVAAGNGSTRASAIASSVAGAGLTVASDVLAVGAGTGITVNANDVAISTNGVSNTLLRDSGACSLIGRSANSSGDPADISAANNDELCRRTSNTVNFGQLTAGMVPSALITPAMVAVLASSVAGAVLVYVSFAAGAGGSADDVTVFNANAPFAFRVLKTFPWVATGVGGATLEGRSASGGGGSALSSTYDAATPTESPAITSSITATTTVAANGSYFIRRSDSGVAGEWVILVAKT